MKRILLIIFSLFFISLFSAYSLDLKKFEGHWRGKGKSIVKWCRQKYISIDLKITKDGKIAGKIGDAKIVSGKIYSNFLGLLNRRYVIDVVLKGYIVKKEKIKRKRIRLLVDIKGDKLIGGFRSSGLKFGGKQKMAITGVDLVLIKVKK